MSLFEKKQQLSRTQLREALRKASPSIPGSGRKFTRKERVGMEKELFPHKTYGGHISQQDCQRRIRALQKERAITKAYAEKAEIDRTIRFLKREAGI